MNSQAAVLRMPDTRLQQRRTKPYRECADQDVDSGDEAHLHDGAKPSERVYFHQK